LSTLAIAGCSSLPKNQTANPPGARDGYESGLDLFCSEEGAEKRGADGLEAGNLEPCGPERAGLAQAAYERGVRIYCKPSNGFVIGTMGVPSRSCEEQEWQEEFKKGQSVLIESKELDKQSL
jgi:hypothetical protein